MFVMTDFVENGELLVSLGRKHSVIIIITDYSFLMSSSGMKIVHSRIDQASTLRARPL
jgi:hypothetical protein